MGSRLACAASVVALITGAVVDSFAQDVEAADAETGAPTEGAAPEDAVPPVVHFAPPAATPPQTAPAATSGAEPKVLGRRFPSPLQVQPEREAPEVSVSIVSPSQAGVRRRGRQGRNDGAESLTGDAEGDGGGTRVERFE